MILKFIQAILARYARRVIGAYRPEIVGITGSVGKTSAKEAIAKVLASHFKLRETYKNYNNELGLPLTILGQISPGRSLSGWLEVFKQARLLARGASSDYPECLILEMGIDHPGDMNYLVEIARPSRAVITKLGTAHLQFFKSLEELHAEKFKLAEALSEDGWIIYNADDDKLSSLVEKSTKRSIGFGFSEGAEVRAEQASLVINGEGIVGQGFKLIYKGSTIPVILPSALGRPAIYAALAAAATAATYDINGLDIANALREVKQPAGRMQLISGKNNSLIIDDSYNSSPDSVFEGLKALQEVPTEKKKRVWIIIGAMKELGDATKQSHLDVAKTAAEISDFVVAVGDEAKGVSKLWFENSEQAADYLADKIEAGDLLYIKGSQAARMEKIVKRLMTNPEEADRLLVRQGKEWQSN